MRNGLVQLGAWAAATGAAVALSWFGVHAVLTGAAFERPTALPLPSPTGSDVPTGGPSAPGPAGRPEPSADPASAGPAPTGSPASASAAASTSPRPATPAPPGPSASRKPSPSPTETAATGAGAPSTATSVRSVLVPGGRAALDIRADRAELVSATPDPGWQMQVWHGDQWMRIDFSKGDSANSVFVTWNGHPPDVQTVVR